MLALVVAVATHYVALMVFVFGTCQVSDTSERVPAPASLQGLLCDRQDSWLNAVPWIVLVSSMVGAVVLAVVTWRRPFGGRSLGLTACLWLPLVVTFVLAVPPDTCTDAQRRDLPAYACDTAGNG